MTSCNYVVKNKILGIESLQIIPSEILGVRVKLVCTITCLKVSQLLLWLLSVHQWTPLHVAAERCRCEQILGYLVEKEADINIQDNKGVNIFQSDCTTADSV